MVYDPVTYWDNRAATWSRAKRADEHEPLGEFLENRLPVYDGDILDVGSGDGQIYQFLEAEIPHAVIGRYYMCDISKEMIKRCYEKTGIKPDLWNGVTLPYDSYSFDAVLSLSVWLHVPFGDIERVVREHMRVSRKYLFVATWYDGDGEKTSGPHCFHHDYPRLFEKMGLTVVEEHKTMQRGDKKIRRCWVLEK